MVHDREATERCPVYVCPRFMLFGKINNMLLCVKLMLVCACVMY